MPAPKSVSPHHPPRRFASAADTAAGNMATDLALLRAAASAGAPALRDYTWTEPALTFGYGQRRAEVDTEAKRSGLPAVRVRRPTGGGIVDHRRDWTYACALPPSSARLPAPEIYRRLHNVMRDVLTEHFKVTLRLAPCPRNSCDPQPPSAVAICFAQPAADDVLNASTGAKVAGAALARKREGLLIQGSLQPDNLPLHPADATARAAFFDHFFAALAAEFDAPGPRLHSPVDLAQWVDPDDRIRFADPEWNNRR